MHPKSLTSGSYSQFDFDETLQFVAVGPLAFNNPKAEAKAGAGAGRRDVTTLFDWLHKKKGVKNIIKVIVDDRNLKGTPHCDEAIINALHPFTIDILDWTKPDLCPKTISEACGKEVRKLYLSWSGLNGMLVAWGGPDGLARLPHLTDVYLRQTEVSCGSCEPHFYVEYGRLTLSATRFRCLDQDKPRQVRRSS